MGKKSKKKKHRKPGYGIAVDGAWNPINKVTEWRGVDIATGEELFRKGPFDNGTINVAEYVAIVDAMQYCQKHNDPRPIYSDSLIAIRWVESRVCRTDLEENEDNHDLFDKLYEAIDWLQFNSYVNPGGIWKWETKQWGEIPADFGRK